MNSVSAAVRTAVAPAPTDPYAEDVALARDAALGDRDAFEAIVRLHGPALYRYARRALSDVGEAQDAVQDALIAAWRDLDRYDGRASLKTWLFSLLAHKVVDLRRRRRAVPVDDDVLGLHPADADADPFAHARRSEFLAALDEALAELPYGQRACWILVEVEGFRQADVATVLSITPDAVRGNLFRARRALTERMARWR